MPTPVQSGQFRRDIRRLERRGKQIAKLRAVLMLLLDNSGLPARDRDQPLEGDWKGLEIAISSPTGC